MAIEWYCKIRGQMRGPLSSQQLKALAGEGQLVPDSLVRQGSSGAWVKAVRVKGLFQGGAADAAKNRPSAGGGDGLEDPSGLPPLTPGVLPVGQIVAPPGGLADFGFPVAKGVDGGAGRAVAQDAGQGGSSDGEKVSIGRIMTVAAIGLAFSFAGLCVIFTTALSKSFQKDYPGIVLVPALLGIVGVFMAVRAFLLNPRRHTGVLAVIGAAAVLGVTAGGWGLFNAVSGEFSLRAYLQAAFGGKGGESANAQWHKAGEEEAITKNMKIAVSEYAEECMYGGRRVLMLKLHLTNISKHKVDYVSWSGRSDDSVPPTLQDDNGNKYQPLKTPDLEDQLGSVAFNPGERNSDMLVFENPKEGSADLELILPGRAIGEADSIQFKIPRSIIKKREEEMPAEPPRRKSATQPAVVPTQPKVIETRSEPKHLDPQEPEPKK